MCGKQVHDLTEVLEGLFRSFLGPGQVPQLVQRESHKVPVLPGSGAEKRLLEQGLGLIESCEL